MINMIRIGGTVQYLDENSTDLWCVYSDDSELDAEVPASLSPRARLRHHQPALQYVQDVRLPRNGVHCRHRVPERKGNCNSFSSTIRLL